MKRILFVTLPAIGHILPMISLIKHYKKDCDVSVVCEQRFKKIFQKIEGINIIVFKDRFYTDTLFNSNILKDLLLWKKLLLYNFRLARTLKKIFAENEVDICISDMFIYSASVLSKKFNKKFYMVYPIIFPFRKDDEPAYNLPFDLPRLMNIIMNKIMNIFFQLLGIPLKLLYIKYGLKTKRPYEDTYLNVDKIILTSGREMHYFMKKIPDNLEFFDYIPKDDLIFEERFTPKDDERKKILISLGTVFNNASSVKKILRRLKINKKKYNIIIVSKIKKEENGLTFIKNVPVSRIMPYFDIFITHGGMNSLLTAYHNKIKTIIFPQGAEQNENKRIFKKIMEVI